MNIFFVTGSKNKFDEVEQIVPNIEQLDIDLPEIQHTDAHEIIKAKLQEAQKHKQDAIIVEDTSLYLDCLNGLPGPLIKWFMKTIGNDGLADIANKFSNNKAQAKTIIGYASPEGKIEFFEGVIEGTIIAPKGETGFGWDPIFLPNGHDKTFAEMSPEVKNKVSMRRIAATKFQEHVLQ